MASATDRGGDTVNAGRILGRALVVIGGAAAVSAIAWLTATASASTVTDEPISSNVPAVVSTIDYPPSPVLPQVTDTVPVVRRAPDAAPPALARVGDLSGAAAHTARLVGVLETSATHAVASVPVTVLAAERIAVAATGLTGLITPADGPLDHIGDAPEVSAAAGPNDLAHAPANSGGRERPADRAVAMVPVSPATTAIAARPRVHPRSDHGAGGLPGRSWLPSCVVPASAGLSTGHDRSGGDAVQPTAAQLPQPSHHRNGVPGQAVTSAEIQPGVTPD